MAGADAERMKLEASALKDNPLLIQKIIAEKLSDKVQIMMVPSDGKFFFANDVIKGMSSNTVEHSRKEKLDTGPVLGPVPILLSFLP